MDLRAEFDRVWLVLGEMPGLMALTGAKRTTVAMWRARGVFPSDYYSLMAPEVARRGLPVTPELWGQRSSKVA